MTRKDYVQLKETIDTIYKAVGYIPNLQEENYTQIIETNLYAAR